MTEQSWQSEAEDIRASKPLHVLFLCVANSARSQNPLAIRALDEIGIDLRGHHSKGVDTIDPSGVDVVVTLCAEEVCPVFLGKTRRVHWGLPDPAHAGSTEAERLQAFRDVRDELRRRLAVVFAR